MKIYGDNDTPLLDVEVDDSSYRHRAIMGDYNLTLYYSLAEHVELPVGAYCVFQGERYTLIRPEAFKMRHSRNFEYTVTMESPQAYAKMWKFRNPVDGRLKFSLTAKPHEHLQMFIDNMNRRDTGWQVGECVDGNEVCISYNHAYCYDALSQMASKLGTEFEFVGKTVHLHKVEYNKNNPLPLSYGRGNGFRPDVGRSNYGDTPPVEILFTEGGTQNIDAGKYGSAELLLPKSQTIGYDGVKYSDEEGFNEANARWYTTDDKGYSIRRTDKELTSLAEDSLDCSDIYPKRVGTISGVEAVDKENNFYDFFDDSIPDSLDYSKCRVEGETMTVIFQSGMLAGKEFEIEQTESALTGYVHSERRFRLVPQEIDGMTMPGGDFVPRPGDTYAVFHCALPDAYICDNSSKSGASWDMFRKGVKYLFDNEETKFTFSGELDGIWSKKDWTNIGGRIKLGGYIKFSDKRFQKDGVLVRIIGIKDYINNPYSPELELSNNTVGTSFSTKLKELESAEVTADDYHREALQFTKRRFRDAKETMSMLEAALLDNFTNSISPIAIQTMQMLVGDESLQFRFVNSKTNPVQVAHTVAYDAATKQLSAEAGIIQHLTLGINTLSSSHKASEYKYWNIEAYESARLDDGSKRYYLYAKVSKTAQTGVFLLSETAVALEGVSGYYHLLVGVLNSEYDGERSFAALYGYSEILPGRITTDRIVSGDGGSYFDMVANAMKLGDALDFNSRGDGRLRIKGTIVQSQSGSESYIGCYRGVYNSGYVYYEGDEVSYTSGGITSTYRYIHTTPGSGFTPTDTSHWQVVAQGSKGDKGADGQNGKDGEAGSYTELRFSVNGSTTTPPALDRTALSPNGWGTGMPLVGVAQYLWMTKAEISGDGLRLLSQWTTPVRMTPYDGKDGADGHSPAMVYRGPYDSAKTYYGNEYRLDCVKYGNTYYIARIDAGTFSGTPPDNTAKWNPFGASFESVATNLLLAEGANIGDWFIQGGKIVSTLESEDNKVTLDANLARILIRSLKSGGAYSALTGLGSVITVDAREGAVTAQAAQSPAYSTGTAYISPTGVFANLAGTNAATSVSGARHMGAVVGLGFADLDEGDARGQNFVAGVYGRASNRGSAPAYGGYFQNLFAGGLVLGTRYILDNSGSDVTHLDSTVAMVIGLVTNPNTVNIYLPADACDGRAVIVRQRQSGLLRVWTQDGQKIYDDMSPNDHYDYRVGVTGVFIFARWQENGQSVQAWTVGNYGY